MAQGPGRGMDGRPFTIGGIEFVPSWERSSQAGSLTLLKARRMVTRYEGLLAAYQRPNMVEIGISQGGSVALFAVLCDPSKLVALELSPDPIEALAETLRSHGLTDSVRPYYGVDQSDVDALAAIVADEFGAGRPLDVVVDDASHLYGPTIASFDLLFPRLRPGGVYVIEDWTWQDVFARNFARQIESGEHQVDGALRSAIIDHMNGNAVREKPLSLMALEAVLARAHDDGAIESVTVDEDWISVVRGPDDLPDGFSLSGAYLDHYQTLNPA